MPIDRYHAFAGGRAYHRNIGWRLHLQSSAARQAGRAWRQFATQAQVAAGCLLGPNAWCINGRGDQDRIAMDEDAICRGLLRVETFGDGRIILGKRVYVGDDGLLSSSAAIEIGSETLIAHGVQIFDNDSHPVDLDARSRDLAAALQGGKREEICAAPVRIGHRAWIGAGAIILKGVQIGDGAVIGAGSVVTERAGFGRSRRQPGSGRQATVSPESASPFGERATLRIRVTLRWSIALSNACVNANTKNPNQKDRSFYCKGRVEGGAEELKRTFSRLLKTSPYPLLRAGFGVRVATTFAAKIHVQHQSRGSGWRPNRIQGGKVTSTKPFARFEDVTLKSPHVAHRSGSQHPHGRLQRSLPSSLPLDAPRAHR